MKIYCKYFNLYYKNYLNYILFYFLTYNYKDVKQKIFALKRLFRNQIMIELTSIIILAI